MAPKAAPASPRFVNENPLIAVPAAKPECPQRREAMAYRFAVGPKRDCVLKNRQKFSQEHPEKVGNARRDDSNQRRLDSRFNERDIDDARLQVSNRGERKDCQSYTAGETLRAG